MKTAFSKSTQISNFIKNRPQGTEFFHVDEQIEADMTKLVGTSQNFVNMPKN
jgi:hypothetical protein